MCDYQVDRIFSERLSGANTYYSQLRAMFDDRREDNTLCFESIISLGRSTKDLLNIIDIFIPKGITLVSRNVNAHQSRPQLLS